MILRKIQTHTKGLVQAFLFMFITMVLANSATELYFKVQDKIEPTSNYFLYEVGNEVIPISDTFIVGEPPTFYSNVEIFREASITWNDTLWCNGVEKYKTQVWKDRVYPAPKADPPILWQYTAEKVTEPKTCRLCSSTYVTTERGVQKSQKFCTTDFKFINQ